jgi:hypothetical protein
MSLIILSCTAPVASFAPSVNPDYDPGYIRTKRYHQPRRMMDDGMFDSARKGESGGRTIRWPRMPAADLPSFRAFFDTIGGPINSFTLTDMDEATYAARQVADSLSWREVEPGFFDASVDLELE